MNDLFLFFNIEKRIGIKKLTPSDLGTKETSNQSHIGLYQDVLQFLGNNVVTTAMLVYEDSCRILDCFFDRIENPDGTYRSPKIRKGNKNEESVVSEIRAFALSDTSADWYLLWSGLENRDLVFWLVNSKSDDFNLISSLVDVNIHTITEEDTAYSILKKIMVSKINCSSIEIQKDIEILSQTGYPTKKYKPFDLEKAKKNIVWVGKRGEELVNEYLKRLKVSDRIKTFEWMNQSRESGLPYDFILNKHHYIDVKSTRFDFSQDIVFSNQEVSFANQQLDSAYSVYRVFEITETNANLRICTKCAPYMMTLNKYVQTFNESIIQSNTRLLGLNIAVAPDDCFQFIQNTIRL